jgi:hypothetical protein
MLNGNNAKLTTLVDQAAQDVAALANANGQAQPIAKQ